MCAVSVATGIPYESFAAMPAVLLVTYIDAWKKARNV